MLLRVFNMAVCAVTRSKNQKTVTHKHTHKPKQKKKGGGQLNVKKNKTKTKGEVVCQCTMWIKGKQSRGKEETERINACTHPFWLNTTARRREKTHETQQSKRQLLPVASVFSEYGGWG